MRPKVCVLNQSEGQADHGVEAKQDQADDFPVLQPDRKKMASVLLR